jgi:GAF domain-containing protein
MSHFNQQGRSWKEIAMDVVGESDRARFRELAQELDDALAMQALAHHCRRPAADINSSALRTLRDSIVYEKIVDVAVALMRSDFASVQMLFPERGTGGELRLLAFRGFNRNAAKFWEWVRADSKSTCGLALRQTRRVVAEDIVACDFMTDSEDQQVYLKTGIHACQTTPLVAGDGKVVGMISTHWRTPHQPSEKDLRLFDILARQTANLMQACNPDAARLLL